MPREIKRKKVKVLPGKKCANRCNAVTDSNTDKKTKLTSVVSIATVSQKERAQGYKEGYLNLFGVLRALVPACVCPNEIEE